MKKKNIRPKIAILISKLIGGGAERVACNLANYLYDKGYDVDIVTGTSSDDAYDLKKEIGRIVLLDRTEHRGKIYNARTRFARLKKYMKENRNVVCYVAMMPKAAFRVTLLRRYSSGGIIISERNDPAHHDLMDKMMMLYASRKCDGLVVQTNEIGDWYRWAKNKMIIPNAVNRDIIVNRRYPIRKKFVAVGKLKKQKNYPMLIDAFSMFNKKYPDYNLDIYGEGELEGKIKKQAVECGVGDKVRFMGYRKDAYQQMADATGFLMTSNYEGISNALIEAMCIGLPCIVTDCDGGGARALIRNGENGVIVEKGAVSKFAVAMCNVVKNDNFSKKISDNARRVRINLSEEKIYGKWLDYIIKNEIR